MHVFIINLEEDVAKKERIEKECKLHGLHFDIIRAVNGKKLTDVELNETVKCFDKGYLTKGEIGCALSHKAVYQRIVEGGMDMALVLEDDAKLGGDINYIIERIEAIANPNKKQAFLLQKCKRVFINREIDIGNEYLFHESYGPKCTHGYVITKAAAEAILRINTPVTMVADNWLTFYFNSMLKTYALNGNVVTSHDVNKEHSSIEKERTALTKEQSIYRDKIIATGLKYNIIKIYHKSLRRLFLKKITLNIQD